MQHGGKKQDFDRNLKNDSAIMDGQSRCDIPSPLRNSKAVNRPFQSPLRSVLSPGGKVDHDDKRQKNSSLHSSPYNRNLTTPERRISRQPQLLSNKICQESKEAGTDTNKERSVDDDDLKRIRARIAVKKQEVEHMKQQSLYEKKHKPQDLKNLIEKWLRGCQEALTQFQKDICQHGGIAVEMTEILSQLGIPPKLVQYSVEDCDFV